MELSCTKCGKAHNIPDSAVENKKIFFYCSSCGHKIVVDNRKHFVNNKNPHKYYPVISDIFTAIPISFNINSILLGSIYAILTLLISVIFIMIGAKNMSSIMQNPALFVIIASLFFLFFYYAYLLLLYFISKITFFKIINPDHKKIDWRFINFDIKEDSVILLIISAAFLLVFAILLFPIRMMEDASILYSGFLMPVFYILSFILFISILLIEFIPAIIASRSQYIGDSFKEIILFIKTEFINIPVYMLINKLLAFLVYKIVFICITIPLLIAGGVIGLQLNSETKSLFMTFFTRVISKYKGTPIENLPDVSNVVTSGVVFMVIFTLAIAVFLFAFFVSINQTICAKSVYIMQKNPIRSINRNAYLIALLVIAAIAILKSGFTLMNLKQMLP